MSEGVLYLLTMRLAEENRSEKDRKIWTQREGFVISEVETSKNWANDTFSNRNHALTAVNSDREESRVQNRGEEW
jgi:hypothetical protein